MKKHNSVYLAWQAPNTKDWHIVGLLTENVNDYTFNYTRGAKSSSQFIPFSGMEDLNKKYISQELFPLFQNRLLSSKRPEYPSFLKWLGLYNDNVSPISILGRSGGLRGTDKMQMFNPIEYRVDGSFEYIFFAHGLGHLSPSAHERVLNLKPDEKLLFCLDCQNSYDEDAVIIRAENPAEIVGYCPRYLANDILKIIKKDKNSINISVETLSNSAPDNYKLMCKISGKIDMHLVDNFMSNEEFQLITENGDCKTNCVNYA